MAARPCLLRRAILLLPGSAGLRKLASERVPDGDGGPGCCAKRAATSSPAMVEWLLSTFARRDEQFRGAAPRIQCGNGPTAGRLLPARPARPTEPSQAPCARRVMVVCLPVRCFLGFFFLLEKKSSFEHVSCISTAGLKRRPGSACWAAQSVGAQRGAPLGVGAPSCLALRRLWA
jgi:hypothetical protein